MKWLLLQILYFYKKHISPHTMPKCRYTPSCSSYAMIAIHRFGVVKGLCLAGWRLLRCNPFSKGGYDPVPENLKGDNKWVL